MQILNGLKLWHLKKIINYQLLVAIALLTTVLYYNVLTSFHFLPITEGWFSAYADLVLQGKVPYRDFYLYLTPLYVWIIALIKGILGPSFFILRIFGLLVICGISITLFSILKRIFTPAASFAGTVISVIYYQSGNAHITYDFTQILTLFALLSVYSIILAAETFVTKQDSLHSKPRYRFCFFSLFSAGIFASSAFLIKQSNGAFIALGVLLCFFFLIFSAKNASLNKLKCALSFMAGAILPAALVLLYLYKEDALNPFISQIFFNALEAKGNLNSILLNWLNGLFSYVLAVQIYEIARIGIPLILLSHVLIIILKASERLSICLNFFNAHIREYLLLAIFFALYISVISLAWKDNPFIRTDFFNSGRHLLNYIIPLSIVWVITSLLFTVSHLFLKKIPANIPTSLLAIGTAGIIFGNGTSAGLSEISAFIPLAWLVAWLCNKNTAPFLGVCVALYSCLLLVTTLSYSKFDSPYTWWGASEPSARIAKVLNNNKLLQKIYISEATNESLNEIIQVLDKSPKKSIFSFPNIPIVYLLTNRWPDSKALITWFDFLNDKDSINEAHRILANPPQTIVYLELPEAGWQAHERLFRSGNPLGQREILKVLKSTCLLESGYKITLKKKISPESTIYICEKLD